MPPPDKDIPLTRALGRFLGHLWHATARPAPRADTTTVRKSTEERPAEIDGRKVTLRRTTIEEVEFRDD